MATHLDPAPVPVPRPQPRLLPPERAARPDPSTTTVSAALLEVLARAGAECAYGLSGGAIAPLCDALGRGPLRVLHFRHEGGAGFAATEAYFSSGCPSVMFATSGPGVTNAITGVAAARWEGAKVVLLSGGTSAPLRGKWACQETSSQTLPISGLFTAGPLFHYATTLENPAELPEILARLASGLARPGGFVAHVSLPTSMQGVRVPSSARPYLELEGPACEDASLERYARMLSAEPFVIWAGFGARDSAAAVRELAERTGAAVMCSPRAKGIFPEDHPRFLGVTGLGGHGTVDSYLAVHRPAHILVLGTRLSEPTSYYEQGLVPRDGFIHVDLDPEVPGMAYPGARTFAVHAEIGAFLRGLLPHLPARPTHPAPKVVRELPTRLEPAAQGARVRARALMEAIQRIVVDGSDAVVMTESGNAFAWGNQLLSFREPGRYRVSTLFGSMGHMTAGVVGAAIGRRGKAVAVVGDGSMLMGSEVSTAVQYRAKAVWIVMNDGCYGMVDHGMRALGLSPSETSIPPTDFVLIARGVGADGARVETEAELEPALEAAMAAPGPFVVDVATDPGEAGPWIKRIQNLITQGAVGASK